MLNPLYRAARPLLFRLEPEVAHERALGALRWLSQSPARLQLLASRYRLVDPRLEVRRFGLVFPNPIGLAAGFDKNAAALPAWPALGFGFVEAGTVTALPQPGNPRPRLFRLPEDEALINRMGFNNAGVEAVARCLAALREAGAWPRIPVGLNVGKSRATPLDEAVADYRRSLELLWPLADYLVLNVSSPNTPGLRQLQEGERLEALLALVESLRRGLGARPVLLKISPDLESEALAEIVALAERYRLDGLIATNTTLSREGLRGAAAAEAGGLSGRPLQQRSLEVLRQLRALSRLPIVSVGGIGRPEDVVERLAAGACLVQAYTGFVYHGPGFAASLARGLLRALDERGAASVEELIDSEG